MTRAYHVVAEVAGEVAFCSLPLSPSLSFPPSPPLSPLNFCTLLASIASVSQTKSNVNVNYITKHLDTSYRSRRQLTRLTKEQQSWKPFFIPILSPDRSINLQIKIRSFYTDNRSQTSFKFCKRYLIRIIIY